MLKKKFRLTSDASRKKLHKTGVRTRIGGLFLNVSKNDVGHVRVAVILGKKYDARACKRNRQKRVIIEALSTVVSSQAPFDILISYTSAGKVLSYKDAKQQIEKALRLAQRHRTNLNASTLGRYIH